MLLARLDEHSGLCANRPCALFLTEGHHLPAYAFQLLELALKQGFTPFAAPWFAVHSTDKGIFLAAGIRMTADGRLPITDWCWVRPRLLTPLFRVDVIARAALSKLADDCPHALISFHPGLEMRNARCGKPHNLCVIPALIQARPRLVRLYMEEGLTCSRAGELLRDWWDWRLQLGLSRTAMFPRLLLSINLHVAESIAGSGVHLVGVDLLPYGGYVPEAQQRFWLQRASAWLRFAYERAYDPPTVLLPRPSHYSSKDVRPLVLPHNRPAQLEIFLPCAEHWFSCEEGRTQLRYELMRILDEGEHCIVTLSEDSAGVYKGMSAHARKVGGYITLDYTFSGVASSASVPHPLSALLPSLDSGHCYVETSSRNDAGVTFLDSRLIGPKFPADGLSTQAALLNYLARSVNEDTSVPSDPFGRRYVEPGVGRGYLVDFLRIEGRPEIVDFSVIGGGLTSYSREGYVNVGRTIDGKVTLGRAIHRKLCADRLEEAGCRTAPVVAVIALTNERVVLPGGKYVAAALLVRGFRSVLRIKQLDPVACLYHSLQARPKLVSFLTDSRWNLRNEKLQQPLLGTKPPFFAALGRWGMSAVLPSIASRNQPPLNLFDPDVRARQCRFRATRMYAPFLVDLVKARVATEIGRDPVREPLTNLEYAHWFASTMGRQLAILRQVRFLFDYHQEGISHPLPIWLYSLGENNITLMAEFADLDTGFFVDAPDESSVDELRLTRRDLAILSRNFEVFHRRDLRLARSAVRTLVTIACHGQSTAIAPVLRRFESQYVNPKH
jgi:hypothetical protein